MPDGKNTCCPKCGKQLTLDETGNIGWCSVHQSWYAVTSGYEGVASARTAEFLREKENEKIEEVRKRREVREKREEEAQSQKKKRVLAVLVIILAVLVLIGVFVVKPMLQYSRACSLYSDGNYSEAYTLFNKLGGYRDSEHMAGLTSVLSADNIVAHTIRDVDGDGNDDLVALFEGYSVIVFGSCDNSNVLLISKETKAECLTDFAVSFEKTDFGKAIECYRRAYIENPTDEMKNQLVTAYRKKAESEEARKDYESAISSRKAALDTSNGISEFNEYYALVLRYAESCSPDTAVTLWDEFIEDELFTIKKYSADERALEDAGKLRLSYAVNLSESKDSRTLSVLKEALGYPVDTASVIPECIENFTVSLTRTELRLLLISLLDDDERIREQKELLEEDIASALENWKGFGISAKDVLSIIRLSRENDIAVDDEKDVFRAAAIKASGDNITRCSFADADEDGWDELFAIHDDGTLSCWKMEDGWTMVSSFTTSFTKPTLTLIKSDVYIVLLTEEDETAFSVYSFKDGSLQKTAEEKGIVDYQRNGLRITFGRKLEGSVTRKSTYQYTLKSDSTSSVRTGIDWSRSSYDYPSTSYDTVIRWFESVHYDIPEERALLTASAPYSKLGFSFVSTPGIGNVRDIKPVLYASYDSVDFYGVSYTSSDNRAETVYVAVTRDKDGKWKTAGTSSSFSSKVQDEVTLSSDVLALNSETEAVTTAGEKKTYQVLIPENSRVILNWQSGTKTTSRTAYVIDMYSDASPEDSIFEYELTPMPEKQVSLPFFLTAGVYRFTVETKSSESLTYSVLLEAEPREYLETEGNDTFDTATEIRVGQTYSGSLSSNSDVDYFSFSVSNNGKVKAVLSAESDNTAKIRYTIEVYDSQTGKLLTSTEMAGNDVTAETAGLYLKKGDYFVILKKGTYFYGGEYQLRVAYENVKNTELETNDTIDTATVIHANREITGVFGVEGDIDYYRFTLFSDAVVTPKFSFTPSESNNKAFVFSIYRDSQKLYSVNIGGKENQKVFSPVVLARGTYTLKLENPRFNGRDYRLTLQTSAVDNAEVENNDTIADADELKLNSTVTASLLTEDDIDYYKLKIGKTTTAKLTFSFPPKEEKSTAYVVSIEQNGKTAWRASVKWNQEKLEQEFQFEEGEYYIKVTPSTWDDEIYKLSLTAD